MRLRTPTSRDGRAADQAGADDRPVVTPDLIAYHHRRGHDMREAAIDAAVRRIARSLARLWTRG